MSAALRTLLTCRALRALLSRRALLSAALRTLLTCCALLTHLRALLSAALRTLLPCL